MRRNNLTPAELFSTIYCRQDLQYTFDEAVRHCVSSWSHSSHWQDTRDDHQSILYTCCEIMLEELLIYDNLAYTRDIPEDKQQCMDITYDHLIAYLFYLADKYKVDIDNDQLREHASYIIDQFLCAHHPEEYHSSLVLTGYEVYTTIRTNQVYIVHCVGDYRIMRYHDEEILRRLYQGYPSHYPRSFRSELYPRLSSYRDSSDLTDRVMRCWGD